MDVSLINIVNQGGLILEQMEEKDSAVKKTLMDLGGIIDGTFTFGTGITAMLPAVKQLMSGVSPELTEQDIMLLYITAMWILLNRHKDKVDKLIDIIKNRGLISGLSTVLDFLKSVEDIAIKIGNSLGYTANSLADIVAFTFIAFPILDGILFLINQGLINPGSPTGYLKSVLIGVGIVGFKNIFNHIIKKLGGKLKPLDKDRENLNEEVDFYKETLTMVNDVMEIIKNTTTNTVIDTYFLPEDLRPEELVYEIENYFFTLELTLSRDEEIDDEFHLEAYYAGDDTIEIGLVINPLKEPESYTHIEDYLTEYIRHEIRHAEQEVMGTHPGKTKEDLKGLAYYTQDHEIDAQTSGLNARRRKQGRSFEEVIRGSVENTKLRHGLSDEEGEQLYDILLKDITERYGKESLQESKDLKKNMTLDVGDEIIIIHKSIGSSKHMELFKPYVVTGWNFGVKYHPKMPKSSLTDYHKRIYNVMPIDGKGPVMIITDGDEEWILRPGFRRGEDLYEQTDNEVNLRKKVVLDNEDYRIYVPLDKDGLCNIPNTKYCEFNPTLQTQANRGTAYIIEFKKDSSPVRIGGPNQLLLIDRGKIPFLREPKSQKYMYNTNGIGENFKELLSQEKELQKFFHVKYSLPERIKYNMEFDEDVLLDGKEHSKLGELIYNINNNNGDPADLEEYYGEFEPYTESYYTRGGEDEIEIVPDGINVYLKKDDWIQNVLGLGDGEYYYNLAHDNLYGYDYHEEVDSDELNYMSCWFNESQLRKVTELMNLIEGTDKPIDRPCHEFGDGEIADFFEKYFPTEWDNATPDILYEVGQGIGESRVEEMKRFFENEIFLEYDHIGRDSVRIHIGWEPLLYLVSENLPSEGGTLDTLFSQDKQINYIHTEPQDVYYDSYEWSEGTEENVESEIDNFLEKIDDVDIERRKDFIKKVNDYLTKEKFESHQWGIHNFSKKYGDPNKPDRKVGIRKIDTENETIVFDVEGREWTGSGRGGRMNQERYIKSFEDFVTYVQSPTMFES